MRIVLAAAAALAVAAPAVAFEVKWSGDFNHRFMYSTQADLAANTALSAEPEGGSPSGSNSYVNGFKGNTVPATNIDTAKNDQDSDFFGEIKYRLTFEATDDEKKVKGVFGVEFGGNKFGQDSRLDFGGDDNNFEFRYGYIDFEVPFDQASRLKMGLMPVGYNKFLWSDNAAGVKWESKRGPLGYSLGWFRDDVTNTGNGTSTRLTNDDVYAADVTYAIENGPKLNLFGLYKEDGQESLAGVARAMDQKWWLGLAGEGQTGALFYGFTAIYLGGEVDGSGNFRFANDTGGSTAGTHSSLDRSAYLLNAEATYKLDKARLKAGWLYTTGDDDAEDGDLENFENIDAYMGGFGSVVIFDSFADDSTLVTTPYIMDKGLNMPYINLDYDLNDKTSVGVAYLWINAAEDIDGKDAGGKGDTEIGHEISARASYKITKNLSTGIEAGYLIGGNAWDELASDKDGDDVFRTDARFRFTF